LNHHDRFGRLLVAGKEYIAFIAKQLDMSIFFQFPQILMVKNGYRSAELVLHAKGNNPHYPLGILLLGLKPFIRAKNLLVKHPIPTFILSNHRENILQGRQDFVRRVVFQVLPPVSSCYFCNKPMDIKTGK